MTSNHWFRQLEPEIRHVNAEFSFIINIISFTIIEVSIGELVEPEIYLAFSNKGNLQNSLTLIENRFLTNVPKRTTNMMRLWHFR